MGWSCPDILQAPVLPALKKSQQTMPETCHWCHALEGCAWQNFIGRTDTHVEPFPSKTLWPNTSQGKGKESEQLILTQAWKPVILCLVRDGAQVTSSWPFITVNTSTVSSGVTGRVNRLADKYKITCNRGINGLPLTSAKKELKVWGKGKK